MNNKDNLGNLAYYDTLFNGLIPCKVTGYDGYMTVYFTVTSNKGAYKRGEQLYSTPYDVVPRKMVYIKDRKYRIKTYYKWIQGEQGTYAIVNL